MFSGTTPLHHHTPHLLFVETSTSAAEWSTHHSCLRKRHKARMSWRSAFQDRCIGVQIRCIRYQQRNRGHVCNTHVPLVRPPILLHVTTAFAQKSRVASHLTSKPSEIGSIRRLETRGRADIPRLRLTIALGAHRAQRMTSAAG